MQISLSLAITSPIALWGGQPPEPNVPEIESLTLVGSGEVGSPIGYSVDYVTPPYPSPTHIRQWLKDSLDIEGATGSTYIPTADDEGSMISLSLAVHQSSENFDTAVSAPIVISWPAPILQDVAISPSSGNTGDTFTVNYTVVGFGISLSQQWFDDGVIIEGATGATYQVPPGVVGVLSCRVTATNSGGSVSEDASPAATVEYAEDPALTGWAITPSSGIEAGDALVVQGTVTGVPTPDLTYQWTLDGSNITGATAATLGSAPEGAVRCVITATNSEGVASVTVGPVTVAAIGAGPPTLSGIPDQNLTASAGVQSLDLSTYATGDNLAYSEIQTDNLTSIAALVVQEGVGGTRNCSGAFPFAEPVVAFSYALTGAAATFTVGSDPRGGITDADLPAGISINAATGLVTVSAAAADMTATNFTVWKFTASVVASQALSITITDVPEDVWNVTYGAETVTVSQYAAATTPSSTYGVEIVTRNS